MEELREKDGATRLAEMELLTWLRPTQSLHAQIEYP
jgi:hypothetical protein